jgi:DNA repair exonuclease SbcCD ATPase subunit
MQLLKATIENFLIIGKATIDLNQQGLVLVLGYNQDGGKADSNGVGKCLSGSTILTDAVTRERITIKELYARQDSAFTVFGLDTDLILRPSKVITVIESGIKELLKITLYDGTTERVSVTHPIMTGYGTTTLAKNLKVGDSVAQPRTHLSTFDNAGMSDICWAKVIEIQRIAPEQTYDIQIDNETSLYALDGFITHNSSIFEAICWCLYGQTYKGLKFDDVVSYASPGGTRVEVDLCVGKDELTVVRHREHKTGKNKLHLFINGKNKTPFKQADAEAILSSLLPLSLSAFKHVIYFGQKMGETFLSLNDTGRKQLLEELIGLDVFSKAEKKVKQRLKDIKSESSGLDGSRTAFKTSIISYEKEIEELEATKDDEMLRLAEERKTLANTLVKLQDERKDAVEQLSLLEDFIREVNDQHIKALNDVNVNKALWDKAESARRYCEKQIREHTSRISNLLYLTGNCPTCEQEIDKEHVAATVAAMEEGLTNLHTELGGYKNGATETLEKLDDSRETLNIIKEKIAAVNLNEAKMQVNDVAHRISGNKSQASYLDREEAALNKPTEALRRAITTTEGDLAVVESKLSVINDELPYLEFWEKGFSATGVRSMILDDVITYLNSRMNHHSRAISDGEIAIELTPQTKLKSGQVREKMDIVASTGGAGYIAASGGQQRRMDLAVHFALSDLTATITGHKMNLLVCDEVLDCIDESGTDAILEMLEEKADAGMSVFLISHSDALNSRISNILLATRNSNVSTVERIS